MQVVNYDVSGIYRIFNCENGKSYYGQSARIGERFKGHLKHLMEGKHCNKGLQQDFDMHGAESFFCQIVELVDEEKLNSVEQLYLDMAKRAPGLHYNMSYVADVNRAWLHELKPLAKKSVLAEFYEDYTPL